MTEIEVAIEAAGEQNIGATLGAGDLLDVGPVQIECLEVRGNKTRLIVRQKPLTAKRTIDKVSTTR